MPKKSKLQKIASSNKPESVHSVVKLLLADHKLMRKLMGQINSKKATAAQKTKAFGELEKVIKPHVKAEENTFLNLIKDNPKFKDLAVEGYEEHRVHETVLSGIHKLRDKDRKIEQMKIFCEILEHHLDEEEDDLFPRFKKYAAMSTRKKIGKEFLAVRKRADTSGLKRGATKFAN